MLWHDDQDIKQVILYFCPSLGKGGEERNKNKKVHNN